MSASPTTPTEESSAPEPEVVVRDRRASSQPVAAVPEGPTNVVAALARVMLELPGIGKDQQASASQGSYSYRGIEAITAEAQKLLGRYGVVFVPKVLSVEIRDLVVAGKPWTDTILRVRYRVYGPGGPKDFIRVGPLLAIGRDNSDKGANKAMTQAYKYALLQVLCIGDSKDDADSGSPSTDRHGPSDERTADEKAQGAGWRDEAERVACMSVAANVARAAGKERTAIVKAWLAAHELFATGAGGWARSLSAFRWLAENPEATEVDLELEGFAEPDDRAAFGADALAAMGAPTPDPDPEAAPAAEPERILLTCPAGHSFQGPAVNVGKQCPRCKDEGVQRLLEAAPVPEATDAPDEAATGVSEPAPEADDDQGAEPEGEACSVCGSTRARTVEVKGVRRCQNASDCARRVEAKTVEGEA